MDAQATVGGLPFPVSPMIATSAPGIPEAAGKWAYEPKFDGFRCISVCSRDRVILESRRGKRLMPCFPEVVSAVAELEWDIVLDGEIVLWHHGRLDFAKLQRRLTGNPDILRHSWPAAYVVFDLLAHGGKDLRAKPYRQRRAKLEKLLNGQLPTVLERVPRILVGGCGRPSGCWIDTI